MSIKTDATQSDPVRITIEAFSPSVRKAYAHLFADAPDKLAELSWRFQFIGHGKPQFAIARLGDDKVVGMIALVPTLLCGTFGKLKGLQAIDTIVSPVARGKFLFIRLAKVIHGSPVVDAEVVWGFPNAIAARGWFGKLGWKRFGSVPFLIRPLRTGYFFARLWRPLSRIDFSLDWPASKQCGTVVREIDHRWDELWRACRGELGLATDRSAAWLRWRLKKPGANYRFAMKVGPDGAEAAVITRLVNKHGAKICYVMEALATSKHQHTLKQLLANELRDATRSGADLALAWCNSHSPSRLTYSQTGFFNLADRFRPIQIHFGGRWLPSGEALGQDLPAKKWYLSYLDSDTV